MHLVVALLPILLLTACAATSSSQYRSEYDIVGHVGRVDESTAERLQIAAVDAALQQDVATYYDQPPRLIRAPQPTMPTADIDERVTGKVVVDILFAESGRVEQIFIRESPTESLTQSVRSAVQQWQITPSTRAGKPAKVQARQTFIFKTDP